MPYEKKSDLPDAVKELPEQAQSIFRAAFNSAHEDDADEERAFRIAWAAVKKSYVKDEDGTWRKKVSEATTHIETDTREAAEDNEDGTEIHRQRVHEEEHYHGGIAHSHPHLHVKKPGNRPAPDGTVHDEEHTHCASCGSDDRLCGHGKHAATMQEAGGCPPVTWATPTTIAFAEAATTPIRVHESYSTPIVAGTLAANRRSAEVEFISPGPGNARDGNYYTPQAVADIARLITGRPMYVNHSGPDDKARGHRDVRMKAATVRSSYVTPEGAARGTVRFLPTHAWLPDVLADDPTAAQVSIDGNGQGRQGTVDGKKYTIIEGVKDVYSADWVPEAGARGRFVRFTEAARAARDAPLSHDEELEMLDTLTPQEIRDANRPLFDACVALHEAATTTATTGGADDDETGEDKGEDMDNATIDAKIKEATAPLLGQIEEQTKLIVALQTKDNQAQTATYVREALRADTSLKEASVSYLAGRFTGATVGDGCTYGTAEALNDAIRREVDAYKATLPTASAYAAGMGGGFPTGLGDPTAVLRESASAAANTFTQAASPTALVSPATPVDPFAGLSEHLGNLMGLQPAAAVPAVPAVLTANGQKGT